MKISDSARGAGPKNILTPALSSWGYRGYAEVWLDGVNDWIYRHLHAAEDHMVRLAREFPGADGLVASEGYVVLLVKSLAKALADRTYQQRVQAAELELGAELDHLRLELVSAVLSRP